MTVVDNLLSSLRKILSLPSKNSCLCALRVDYILFPFCSCTEDTLLRTSLFHRCCTLEPSLIHAGPSLSVDLDKSIVQTSVTLYLYSLLLSFFLANSSWCYSSCFYFLSRFQIVNYQKWVYVAKFVMLIHLKHKHRWIENWSTCFIRLCEQNAPLKNSNPWQQKLWSLSLLRFRLTRLEILMLQVQSLPSQISLSLLRLARLSHNS